MSLIYMKRSFPSLIIRKMQVKTIQRYHFSPIELAKIHLKNPTTCFVIHRKIRQFPAFAGKNAKWYNPLGSSLVNPTKIKNASIFCSAISVLRIFYSYT